MASNYSTDDEQFQDISNRLDILLIGKTGNGKSSTGNSILNKKPAPFKESYQFASETKSPAYATCVFMDYEIQVVDCPGVMDTNSNISGGIKMVHSALKGAMMANTKGYHAFLIVLKFGTKFTAEENNTIGILKGILGHDFLKKYGIIVMTNGDTFEHDCENDKTLNLNTFCGRQEGAFQDLLKECENRIVLFNNITPDTRKREEQRMSLLELLQKVNNNGKRYTNEHFEAAQKQYSKIIGRETTVVEKEVIVAQSWILDKIKNCKSMDTELRKLYFGDILKRIDLLQNRIARSNKTEALEPLQENISKTRQFVETQLRRSKEDEDAIKSRDDIEKEFIEIKETLDISFFDKMKYFIQKLVKLF